MVKPEEITVRKVGNYFSRIHEVVGYPEYKLERQTRPGRLAYVVFFNGEEIGEAPSMGGDQNVPIKNFLAEHINGR